MPIRQGKYRPDRTKLSAAMAVSTARQRGLCRAYRRFAADSGSTGRHAIARQTGTVCDLRGLPVAEQWCASESLGGLIFGIRLMNEFPGRGFLSTFAVDKGVHNHDLNSLSGLPQTIFFPVTFFIQEDCITKSKRCEILSREPLGKAASLRRQVLDVDRLQSKHASRSRIDAVLHRLSL